MQEMRRTASRCACLLALTGLGALCLPASALAVPEASFTFSPNTGITGSLVKFDASASKGEIETYSWNFGDGSIEVQGPTVEHAYAKPGSYPVTLTVTDKSNEKDSLTQPVTVKSTQEINFTSAPPATGIVGTTYTVSASGGGSGEPVEFSTSGGACTNSGTVVTFTAPGNCVITANQAGNAEYEPALQQQQGPITVNAVTITPQPAPKPPASPPPSPAPTPSPSPAPKARIATFRAVSATLHSPSFTITLKEQVSDPGTLSWVLTFPNRTFGVFAAAKGKCKAGFMRLGGKCRPKKVTYGRGSVSFAAAGTVTITVKPSAAAKKALRTAMRKKKNMRITAVLTFKPSTGAAPVIHTQVLTVKLAGAK